MSLSVQGERGRDGEMLACHCLYREREGEREMGRVKIVNKVDYYVHVCIVPCIYTYIMSHCVYLM